MPYDLLRYTDPDTEGIHCRVTVTLPDGTTRTVTGDYLDLEGYPVLRCGIEEAAQQLGLVHLLDDTTRYTAVCQTVTRQLAWRPFAVLRCPELSIRINLIPPR